MKNNNLLSRLPLNITVFLILLPMVLSSQFRRLEILEYIQSLIEGGQWLGLLVIFLAVALYVASFIFIIWKGRLLLGMTAIILIESWLVFFVLRIQINEEAGPRQLIMRNEPGMKVYCNDVYLGETPIEISKDEFRDKVKPWDTPPRQKMILGLGGAFAVDNKIQLQQAPEGRELRWFYIPCDYFNQHRAVDRLGLANDLTTRASRFWWRFEKDGCAGLTTIEDMIQRGSNDALNLRNWAHPHLSYPSLQPYLEHLLHDLKSSNYQPSMEWRTLVGNSSGLLFRQLHVIGQRDPRVARALEMAIQTEFGISAGMSAEVWEAVLDGLMSRVKERQSFGVSSPETIAMDLMIQHNMQLIETRFLGLLSQQMDPTDILSLRYGQSVQVYRINEVLTSRLLEYAVLKSCPPALFKRLVYESRRGERFLAMVGNYSRPEARQLLGQYLDDVARPNAIQKFISSLDGNTRRMRALDVIASVRQPALEPEMRRFVLEHTRDGSPSSEYYFRQFIDSRLERSLSETEADSLAEWIVEMVPRPDIDKLQFLLRVNSDRTYHYLRDILQRQAFHPLTIVHNLIHQPNQSLDRLLIEIYQAESAGVKFGGIIPVTAPRKVLNVSRDLIRAMMLCDTPRMRAFLERLWAASDANKIDLMEAIKQEAPRHFPHLYEWTALISEIEDADTRLAAISVLDRIDTPESSKVLENWAQSPNAAVNEEAEWALTKYRERSRNAEALLAGSIKPDDLLVGHQAYIWDGKNYVPETETSGK